MRQRVETATAAEKEHLMIFDGLANTEVKKVLNCLKAKEVFFPRDSFVLNRGTERALLGIVLAGSVFMTCTDREGNRAILTNIEKNEIFGMSMLTDDFYDNLSIVAAEDCRVLIIDAHKLFWGCEASCATHKQMLYNVITILSRTNMSLMRKFRHVSQHSLRRKISSYLDEQAQYHDSLTFKIPFNRQEMADYLGADRSALSAELSRMKKEGLIDYEKNRFALKCEESLL